MGNYVEQAPHIIELYSLFVVAHFQSAILVVPLDYTLPPAHPS